MIDILKQIIAGAYIVNSNTLEDEGMKVILNNIPSSSLIVKVKEGKSHLGMINKNLRKSCDFIIFNLSKNKLDVYLIELKKTKGHNSEKKQNNKLFALYQLLTIY